MDLASSPIFQFLAQYAYEPVLVYCVIVLMMFLSSFGFPIPEEVTLLSAGLIAHMGAHPELYPPPYPGAAVVSIPMTAAVCLFAVFLSDFLVFMLGKTFGSKMLRGRVMSRLIKPAHMLKVQEFTGRYGSLACGIFRFTPGLRFPGHFACGSVGIPVWKFVLVDGLAALISVPTQVVLMALYGEIVIQGIKEFKVLLIALLACVLVYWLVKKVRNRKSKPELPSNAGSNHAA